MKYSLIALLFLFSCGESLQEYEARRNKEMEQSQENQRKRLEFLTDSLMNTPREMPHIRRFIPKDTVIENIDLKAIINNQIQALSDGFQDNEFQGSFENVIQAVSIFYLLGDVIYLGSKSDDPDIIKLSLKLNDMTVKAQVKTFPVLRDRYAKLMQEWLWEKDYKIFSKGSEHDRIVFINRQFSTNMNIKQFHTQFLENLRDLRFKKAIYNWCYRCGNPEILIINTWDDNIITHN